MTTTHDTYDLFASTAAEYGVELTRTAPSAATATIESLVDGPAVGAELPWDDVSLPASVTTGPTPGQLDEATTGVTAASLAIADYGSLVLEATPDGAEPAALFPDLHLVVLREDDLVPDMASAFEWFGERFRETRSSAIIATGPSATADMGSLVKGAHGPKDVHVVVVS